MSKFEPTTHETHISKENEWHQLQTKKEQDEFVKSHGVQWSILNKLDYWRPIEFCGIDIIHCLILGDIKDYCISFLKMGLTGHEKVKNEDKNDLPQLNRPKKQTLTKANLSHIRPPTSQRHQCSSEVSTSKSEQTEKRNRTKSSRPFYSRKFDFKDFQTLKAAEWKILITLYLPLALLPIWSAQIPHREERVNCPGNFLHKDLLLKSLISLPKLTNMLLKTSTHEEDLDKIERTTHISHQTLHLGWSMINSKPNLHLTQHLPKVNEELGTPSCLAAWAYERMNHTFGDIPQNNKPC
ncbi:hypothetical protein O181_001438 [Austropuccinia psidii MF-1]|uniref:Uncharacterized protein n=1 Tax=Austropuccinia psidii MF-1 TaxID=1389203 RepID=A0A9Q3GBQ3_9BASI|nr:hypothetical protein [Austropuccinia psidii MF-1]